MKRKEIIEPEINEDYGNDHAVIFISTEKKSYKLTTDLLEKLYQQSLDLKQKPRLILTLNKGTKQRYRLICDLRVERKDD